MKTFKIIAKRKCVVLPIEHKLDVIKHFVKVKSPSKLASKFDIKKKKKSLIDYAVNNDSSRLSKRKTVESYYPSYNCKSRIVMNIHYFNNIINLKFKLFYTDV